MKKHIVLFVLFGLIYMNFEVLFGALFVPQGVYLAFIGKTSIWMGLLGGMLGVFIGLLNEKTKLSVFKQALIASAFITTSEFIAGATLNITLGFNIWDYSMIPLNIKGQVCLLFMFIWFLLAPFGIWLDDLIRFVVFGETKRRLTLKQAYIELAKPLLKIIFKVIKK